MKVIPPMHCVYSSSRLILLATCAFCFLTHSTWGQIQAIKQVPSEAPSTATATGFVYEDLNSNQNRDDGEPGITGIRVSNGKEIVKTDSSGKYALPVSDDSIVFVIKPSGYKPPTNELNLPQFYYIHKPKGSPKSFRFAGVKPTGPLPDTIDFPLTRSDEPDQFKAILFGDPQPRNVREVEFIEHDVIEQIIAAEAHDASFGVTLGDIVFDDLSVMDPLNQAIALIDIPWYNVIGNHDLNMESKTDKLSDETFERHYGPSYYSFEYGPAHFLVLDDVIWEIEEGERRGHYHAGLGERQLEFIKNDLKLIPKDQLVVLMMHIPLGQVEDRQELYRLIEQRPATVSISAHTHYLEHRFIGNEDGWMGPEKHHHIVNVTVCGSWWRGQPDERGIPHATMSDGGPNGYSIMSFDGNKYSLTLQPAARPANYQMQIYTPEKVTQADLLTTVAVANVFAASEKWSCELRVGDSEWIPMQRITTLDPNFLAEKKREELLTNKGWRDLPEAHQTPHMYRGMLPIDLPVGSHRIEVKATSPSGQEWQSQRIIRIE
ncbi:MAG: calcineurin-like phosphoesterase C-terminal domain-containing protein [Pirellulaceae bacterium]